MSEMDAAIVDLLQHAYPPEEVDLDAGWSEVLRRADVAACPPGRRRPAMPSSPGWRAPGPRNRQTLALVLALVVLLCGTAVAATTGLIGGPLAGFRNWLGAGPGRPASPQQQRIFSRENAASVARFPRGTALRLIIGERVQGVRYDLYGFRVGALLCLQLKVTGRQPASPGMKPARPQRRPAGSGTRPAGSGTRPEAGHPPSCAPVTQLRAGRQPAHLLAAGLQAAAGEGRAATVSYGLATDGVARMLVVDRAGRHTAALSDNAFLYVAHAGERPLGAIAVDSHGDEVPVALQRTTGQGAAAGQLRLRHLSQAVREWGQPSGSLRWLVQRRLRGLPLPREALIPLLPAGAKLLYARQVRPNPRSRLRVGVALVERGSAREVCEILYEPLAGRLAGCAPAAGLFARHYVVGRMLTEAKGGQSYVLVGLASSQVFRVSYLHAGMEMFRAAHLHDGVFAIQMPVSSSTTWLQIDGRVLRASGGIAERELESGSWHPGRAR